MIENGIVPNTAPILITGANGFVGAKVVDCLLSHGYSNLRCFVRPAGNYSRLDGILASHTTKGAEIIQGNLLVREDCDRAARDVKLVYHLAAGTGKTFAGCFLDSVVATRNLLDSLIKYGSLERFVTIGSFAEYSNMHIRRHGLLDENTPIEREHMLRYAPYAFGKIEQNELVFRYGKEHGIRYVILRPGVVFGPGKTALTGRVGIDTFGFFIHLGGRNKIPLTYVDNCADAIVRAGLTKGVDGEIFNVVDDDLPSSRKLLRLYKKNVRKFFSISIPYRVFYWVCCLWERYSISSKGQLPPAFNKRSCASSWKGNKYTNEKMKRLLNWSPVVGMKEALDRYFNYCREQLNH